LVSTSIEISTGQFGRGTSLKNSEGNLGYFRR
jgi:hypothetical protein